MVLKSYFVNCKLQMKFDLIWIDLFEVGPILKNSINGITYHDVYDNYN